ncbi:MAG: HD domain-containing protein [Nitrospirae bacterium]|nr:HD domain-containing protein [Nitrospirota bacterium]
MKKQEKFKRNYFRIDTFLPMQANVVPPDMVQHANPAIIGNIQDLQPVIVNISGGGIAFKSEKEYKEGDTLEIILALYVLSSHAISVYFQKALTIRENMPIAATVRVYGKVLRAQKTEEGHYHTFVAFTSITEKIREIIMNFVFQWERELLRNTQINAGTAFEPVFTDRLSTGIRLPFEIFIRDDTGIKYLFAPGLPYDAIAKEFFEERGISKIYVKEEDIPALEDIVSKKRVMPELFDKENVLSFKKYSSYKNLYHPVDRTLFLPHTDINFSVFVMNDFNYAPLSEITPEQPVTLDEKILSENGYLMIKKSDMPFYCSYLISISDNASVTKNLKPLIIKENAIIALGDLLSYPENTEKMKTAISAVEHIIDCLLEYPDSLYALLSVNKGDFYTNVHCVNVAILCIAAGIELGMSRKSLQQLGIGAMLHDIGHSSMNNELINKQGRFSDTEYSLFKTHVVEGINILRKHEGMTTETLKLILHHHEKMSGKGYPFMLSGDKISFYAQIAAIADAYDLLTTNRPYRKALTSFQALSTFAKEAANYDPMLLKIFIKILVRE